MGESAPAHLSTALIVSLFSDDDARSHQPLTSTVKLSAESSAVATCLQSANNSGQKIQSPIYF